MKKTYIRLMAVALLGLTASSCQKKFDPSTYAPPLDIGGYTSSNGVATGNLVAKWSFEDSLIDSVSNSNGTATGSTFGAGIKGRAFQGATGAYALTAPSSAVAGLKSFTMSEWVNTPAPSAGIIGLFSLVNKTQFWGNLEVFIENGSTNENGKLRIHMFNGTADKTYAVDNVANLFNGWTNIAVSYDETTAVCKLYVNGSRVAQGTVGGLTGPLNFKDVGNVVFGCVQFQTTPSQTSATSKQDWAGYLTGQLDEVRLYNKALTDAEISAVVKLEGRGK